MGTGENTRNGSIERSARQGWRSAVIAAVVLTVASCGQGALPAADPSSARSPTSTAQPNRADNPLPTSIPDPVETTDVEQADDAETPADPSEEQAAAVDSPAPPTDESWQDVTANLEGLDSTCGNVSYVSSSPTRAQVIVGISSKGLFEFDDETVSWNAMGSGAGSASINNRMAWIEYDPLVPERFWQAGSYGDGLFRTDDNGVTFSRLGELRHLDFVSVDPTDPFRAVMMVGVHEDDVIYRSDDGGATWQDLSAALPDGIGHTPYPIVFNPSTHLLGTYRSETAGVFQSRDGGATWTQTYDGAISGPPVVDGDNVYWLRHNGGGVIRSSNRGFSFERGERTGGRPRTLTQLSDGRLVTHNAESLLISADLGVSWTPFGPALPYEPTGVAVSEHGQAVFAWRFSCNFGDEGNPVLPLSIVRVGADFEQS